MPQAVTGGRGEYFIRRRHTIAQVSPPLPAWVLRALMEPRRVYRAGGPRGYESAIEGWGPMGVDRDGNEGILPGLVPRIVSMLEGAGYRVTGEEPAEFGLPARNWGAFRDA